MNYERWSIKNGNSGGLRHKYRLFGLKVKKGSGLPSPGKYSMKYLLFGNLFSELIRAHSFSLLKESAEIGITRKVEGMRNFTHCEAFM